MKNFRILVVTGRGDADRSLVEVLGGRGRDVHEAASISAALGAIQRVSPDLVLVERDVREAGDGLDLIRILHERMPSIDVLLLCPEADMRAHVEAAQYGADDVLVTTDIESIQDAMAEMLERSVIRLQPASAGRDGISGDPVPSLIGRSRAMQQVFRRITRVAQSNVPVLVLGKSGTGKELVAREIHAASGRDGPFLAMNLGAVSPTLIEAELFGHAKGGFTGADRNRMGYFELAAGGTLLLDEIGDMPLDQQARLLRVLQERSFIPVGGEKEIEVETRIVAATNQDLRSRAAEGAFRWDLLWRLEIVQIHLPPLRERPEDLEHLVPHFLEKAAREAGLAVPVIEAASWETLFAHPWPGNVRELEHAITRVVLNAVGGVVRFGDLELVPVDQGATESVVRAGSVDEGLQPDPFTAEDGHFWNLKEGTREHIQAALKRAEGNASEAARLLGVPKSSLQDKMRKLGIK